MSRSPFNKQDEELALVYIENGREAWHSMKTRLYSPNYLLLQFPPRLYRILCEKLDVSPAKRQLIRGKMKLLNNVTNGHRGLVGGIRNIGW